MKNILRLIPLLGAVAFSCSKQPSTGSQATTTTTNSVATAKASVTYTNPVLPGDYADPSVVRVGDDYWATATSSEWAPLYPILHSKNLIDWETVGHVFPDKLPDWAEAHFWAPEITYDKGRYYIYYTAKKKGGNLCVGVASASKPTGPYTDHGPLVCQEVGSIDGFPIRDEQGNLFLIWKEDANSVGKPTPIWGQRMNEERTALTGEKFELFRNTPGTWEGGLVEGPALVKRGDYFYMFYAGDACCGRTCTYGVGVARAKKLTGPWEKHPNNPIMQKNQDWSCPGHGTLVTDQNGRDFFLYHAYSTKSSVYTGRQGLLDEVTWGTDGWPAFKDRSPSVTAQVPYSKNAPEELNIKEEFTSSNLSQAWQWFVGQKPQYSVQSSNGGQLQLFAAPEKIGNVLSQRTTSGNYTVTTTLDLATLPKGTSAGLAAIGDPENAVGLSIQNGEFLVWSTKGNKMNTTANTTAPKEGKIQLRITAQEGDKLKFSWSSNGSQWNDLNNGQAVDASFLPPWDRGVRVGLAVKGQSSSKATFDQFSVINTQP